MDISTKVLKNKGYSKTLVFSSWEMVPRVIASLTSYESERLVNDRIAKINDRIAEIQEAQKRQEDDDEIDLDIINSVNEKRVYAKNAVEPQQIDIQSLFSKFDVNME